MLTDLDVVVIIPARMGSSRFPGKPLKLIHGKPMLQRVYENCVDALGEPNVYVATCDNEIMDAVDGFGGLSVLTSSKHERASDRCAEALDWLEIKRQKKFDAVVMVQGDEPMVTGPMIRKAVLALEPDEVTVVNLLGPIGEPDLTDPNCIKVVCRKNMDAMYMSRMAIPYSNNRKIVDGCGKQVCVIPFKRDALKLFADLSPTRLEEIESIDMLRFLEHGIQVRMVPIAEKTFPVDTPSDLEKVCSLLAEFP